MRAFCRFEISAVIDAFVYHIHGCTFNVVHVQGVELTAWRLAHPCAPSVGFMHFGNPVEPQHGDEQDQDQEQQHQHEVAYAQGGFDPSQMYQGMR